MSLALHAYDGRDRIPVSRVRLLAFTVPQRSTMRHGGNQNFSAPKNSFIFGLHCTTMRCNVVSEDGHITCKQDRQTFCGTDCVTQTRSDQTAPEIYGTDPARGG